MNALELIALMRNYNNGDTIKLNVTDDIAYIANNKQYKMNEFIKLVLHTKNYIVLYHNT